MSDAVVVFHPPDPSKLEPFLDLDEEADENENENENEEESDKVYAEKLDDNTYLLFTFQPFEVFLENPDEALSWLDQFGEGLAELHDDPRGFLFYSDDLEPEGTTYDAVIAELADKGLFVPILEPVVPIQAMNSYDAGKMMEQMQQQIADLLGGMMVPGGEDGGEGEVVDEEFEPDDET